MIPIGRSRSPKGDKEVIPGMSRSRLAGDTGWAMASTFTGLVALTLVFLLLARSGIGPTGYAAYAGTFALMAPAATFPLGGVVLTLFEHIVAKEEDAARVTASCYSLALLTATVLGTIVVTIAILTIDNISPAAIFFLIITELIIGATLEFTAASVQTLVNYRESAKQRIAAAVARIVNVVVLAALGALTLTTFAISQFVAATAVAAWALANARKRTGLPLLPGRVEGRHFKSMMLYSVGVSAASTQADGDKYAMSVAAPQRSEALVGGVNPGADGKPFQLSDAGPYAAAYSIVRLGYMPVRALEMTTHLSFLQTTESSQVKKAAKLTAFNAAYGLVFAVFAWFVVAPLAPVVIGGDFDGTSTMIRALSPLIIVQSASTYAANGLLGLHRNVLRTTILIGNALVAIGLYAYLIPRYSWQGAVAGTFTAEILVALLTWTALLISQRKHDREVAASKPSEAVLV